MSAMDIMSILSETKVWNKDHNMLFDTVWDNRNRRSMVESRYNFGLQFKIIFIIDYSVKKKLITLYIVPQNWEIVCHKSPQWIYWLFILAPIKIKLRKAAHTHIEAARISESWKFFLDKWLKWFINYLNN